jgi:hypothetical protein
VVEQLIEIAGAVMILTAFALNQFRGLDRHAPSYLLLNLAGSLILAVIAGVHQQWGFFLLQAAWGLVSLWGVIGLIRRGGAAA